MNKTPIKIIPPKIIQPNIKKTLFLIFIFIIIFLTSLWFAYQYGLKETNEMRAIIMGTDQQINDQTEHLVLANEKLTAQLVRCQTSTKISNVVTKQAKQQITQEQNQKLALQKENGLLNNLISSNQTKNDGLQVMDFKLSKTSKNQVFIYGFTLTHLKQDKKQLNGQVSFILEGERNGQKKYFKMSEVTAKKQSSKKLRFVHFQRIEGKIILPRNFKPSALIISSKMNGKKIRDIKERFSWKITN